MNVTRTVNLVIDVLNSHDAVVTAEVGGTEIASSVIGIGSWNDTTCSHMGFVVKGLLRDDVGVGL